MNAILCDYYIKSECEQTLSAVSKIICLVVVISLSQHSFVCLLTLFITVTWCLLFYYNSHRQSSRGT